VIARPHALGGEVVGEPVGPLLHFSICASLSVADDVLPLAEVVRRILEEIGEVELHAPRLEHVLTNRQTAYRSKTVPDLSCGVPRFLQHASRAVRRLFAGPWNNVGTFRRTSSRGGLACAAFSSPPQRQPCSCQSSPPGPSAQSRTAVRATE